MVKKIFSQDPQEYIRALAEALKNVPEIQPPEWAHFVKSGTSRARPPLEKDFWYIRSASILRQMYIKGVVGVGRLRTKYGSRKNKGSKPDKFKKSSGKIIRLILQQAEKAGLVEKVDKLQFGRRLTQKGRDMLDSIEVPQKKAVVFEDVFIVQKNPSDMMTNQEDIEMEEAISDEEQEEEDDQ